MKNIPELLKRYNDLSECVLLDFKFGAHLLTLELTFDYVWTDQGGIRPNLQQAEPLILKFYIVQEVHLDNFWTKTMLLEPQHMNWSINEVSLARLEDAERFLGKYKDAPRPFHHLAIHFNRYRRMDIVFSALDIIKPG